MPRNRNLVRFGNAILWVRQPVGQIAVVGDQNQPFAGLVQSAYVIDTLVGSDQVDNSGPPRRIFAGRNDARWFVEDEILKLLENLPTAFSLNTSSSKRFKSSG